MCSPYVAMGTTLEVSLPVCKYFGILYCYRNHCIGLVKCGLSQTPHVHKPYQVPRVLLWKPLNGSCVQWQCYILQAYQIDVSPSHTSHVQVLGRL